MGECQRLLRLERQDLFNRVSDAARPGRWSWADVGSRQQSSEPVFRGRKLVLNYTDGSPCTSASRSKAPRSKSTIGGDDDDDDDENDHQGKGKGKGQLPKGSTEEVRRKSTLISLLCERDPLAPTAAVSFVGASPDECAYFFELRSQAACAGVSNDQQSLGPGGVFGVMSVLGRGWRTAGAGSC